jgi:hypothetical protein
MLVQDARVAVRDTHNYKYSSNYYTKHKNCVKIWVDSLMG